MTSRSVLFVDVAERGSLVLVRLDGIINEDNQLAERVPHWAKRKVLINLAEVERINSCGVRDWVRWLQGFEIQDSQVFLAECSPPVVAQINTVRNFCGAGGQVISFRAPYFCTSCQKEQQETFTLATLGAVERAPAALCQSCGEPLEFDDLEASYFSFTKAHAGRQIDAEVSALSSSFASAQLATKMAELQEIGSGPGARSTPGNVITSTEGARIPATAGLTRVTGAATSTSPASARPDESPGSNPQSSEGGKST